MPNEVLFHERVPNTKVGIKEFFTRCKKQGVLLSESLFCMEHTGVYNNILLDFIAKSKYSVWVEQAVQIKKSLGVQRGKSDKVDSQRIGEYALRYADRCKLWSPPRIHVLKLKKLTTLRKGLIKSKTSLAQGISEYKVFEKVELCKLASVFIQPAIDKLSVQIKKVELEISKVIKEDSVLNGLNEIVTSVKGIGVVISSEIIVVTNEFKDVQEAKKFACYSGVAPFEHSSGTSVRGRSRVSSMANKNIKQLLHMASMVSVQKPGELQEYYKRKVSEGKNKMSVLNAIRNKLIHRIFACVRDGRMYEKKLEPIV